MAGVLRRTPRNRPVRLPNTFHDRSPHNHHSPAYGHIGGLQYAPGVMGRPALLTGRKGDKMVVSGVGWNRTPFYVETLTMALSRQEIKENALRFASEWEGEQRERAESQTFWNEFFAVFGVRRRRVAAFEERVKTLIGHTEFIDLFLPGKMLAEHKSAGADLGKAASQAYRYVCNLELQGRGDESPRYIVVSDFSRIVLHDLEPEDGDNEILEFPITDLHKHIDAFGFISGYQVHKPKPEDPANIRASELMGAVHDALLASGYSGHSLERFLVRTLFCLFAEDTGIFEPDAFTAYIEQYTREDGSDLGPQLGAFFDILDTPKEKRQKNMDESLLALEYVNGGLFAETLRPPICNRAVREALIAAARFDWSRISPAVFGSLFQCVMDPGARRSFGAHYTTEENILKVLRPLFLDDLRAEFRKVRSNPKKLRAFHDRLGKMTFFDPACGCGNFLVLAYRELRRLEMDVFEVLHKSGQKFLDATFFSQVDVDQFYGIEIVEFPVRIAETALWLMDHQMNVEASVRFGQYYVRLPLQKSATIVHGNALRIDWTDVLPKERCTYILGNPPFVGKQYQSSEQKEDILLSLSNIKRFGVLDYVSCWYYKAAEYIQGTSIPVGFVSTNSIIQGEQVAVLWTSLFAMGIHIRFAYSTFIWNSEARGKAHVHCVIIGFGLDDSAPKQIFQQEGDHVSAHSAVQINRYLVDAPDVAIVNRTKPICDVPDGIFGNMPNDGGHLLFSDDQKKSFLERQPEAEKFFRRFLGSEEFINGSSRWCLWLDGVAPSEFRPYRAILRQVELVREYRLASKRATTRELANTPALFGEIRQPDSDYILVPSVSSERRRYVPIGFVSLDVIASNLVLIVPDTTRFHFGVLTSMMHMVWMRRVCGRLESRYRYSVSLVYNNFPWPERLDDARRAAIESKAGRVLEVRNAYPGSTLADLYDPRSMPAELLRAHRELDRAVDRAYRVKPFTDDADRLAFLFDLYEKLASPNPIIPPDSPPKRRRR